ncbi:6-carboxytetrahydropterin synthase QueD [uncultured Duncaniella sp.]|uniref:6-carboxytetrahydropterin synthase QueD n=1 Tax=uncultured Duncaniella sp. TaxID=2768039 RepID=UPI00260D19AA|nr:6-carboxytetrahydropterin synthase QueD [uncultured Duncaniella sp.]
MALQLTNVTKEITFDAAHMLSNYDGKCSNLHGHTYRVAVTLSGHPNTTKTASDSHMVMDFGDLKSIMQSEIMNRMDHALLISAEEFRTEAEGALMNWASKFGKKKCIMPSRTTAEDMAFAIGSWVRDALQSRYHDINDRLQVSVKLWETPTSYAEVKV